MYTPCMQELDRIGEEQSIIIAVGYMLRYNPAIEAAKELLQDLFEARGTTTPCI